MVTQFEQRVYDFLKDNVPAGKVTTYGALARALNSSPRAVGQALRKNPFAPSVPCHRVVASDGSIGGFRGCTQGTDIQDKFRLLKSEGITFKDASVVRENIISF